MTQTNNKEKAALIVTHDEIHILRGLVMALQYGNIESDIDLDMAENARLLLKLEEAHNKFIN